MLSLSLKVDLVNHEGQAPFLLSNICHAVDSKTQDTNRLLSLPSVAALFPHMHPVVGSTKPHSEAAGRNPCLSTL